MSLAIFRAWYHMGCSWSGICMALPLLFVQSRIKLVIKLALVRATWGSFGIVTSGLEVEDLESVGIWSKLLMLLSLAYFVSPKNKP